MSRLKMKFNNFIEIKKPRILHGKLSKTPTILLKIQPGDVVEVKKKEEISATLDFKGKNRGLLFHKELLRYCGGKYRILKKIDSMINESTGKIMQLKNTVILEGVTCDGKFHGNCQRTCYCLWREIWLKKI